MTHVQLVPPAVHYEHHPTLMFICWEVHGAQELPLILFTLILKRNFPAPYV